MNSNEISISLTGGAVSTTRERIYSPGQIVSGYIQRPLKDLKEIEDVNITFQGECFTEITSGQGGAMMNYRETIPLFSFSQSSLYSGPHSAESDTMSWSLGFTLPDSSTFIRTCIFESSNPLFDPENQSLPPSFELEDMPSKRVKARVTYQLVAELGRPKRRIVLPIRVVSLSDQALLSPSPRPISMGEQHYKSKSLRPHHHSLKERLSHAFSNHPALKTPSIKLEATAYMPSSASIWLV